MAFVVNSSYFDIALHHLTSSKSNHKTVLKGFSTFYSEGGEYIKSVNFWFNRLVNIKRVKDISSSVRAIKRYWKYLEVNKFAWDHFPSQKSLKPTYRYRNDDLLRSFKNGDLNASSQQET